MDMVLDTKYGNQWQKWIIQTMIDPLYAGPTPCPCTAVYHLVEEEEVFDGYDCDCQWTEDHLCLGKQNEEDIPPIACADYYVHHDIYEAMCYVPAGAPPLPDGCSLTSSYFLPRLGAVIAIEEREPIWPGLDYVPWYDYSLKENCVCIDGRYAPYYIRNGVTCDTVEEGI